MSRWLATLAVGMAVPAVSFACASCNDPKSQDQSAFLGPTIFMSLLPLCMLGAIAGFLWWSTKRAALLPSSPSP